MAGGEPGQRDHHRQLVQRCEQQQAAQADALVEESAVLDIRVREPAAARPFPAQPVEYRLARVRLKATTGLPVAAGSDLVHDVFGRASMDLSISTQRRK